MKLPPDIRSIVYRYLYSTVLDELRAVYGKTLRLKCVLDDQLCKRIKNDVMNYGIHLQEKGWRCAYTDEGSVSEACDVHWLAYWESIYRGITRTNIS